MAAQIVAQIARFAGARETWTLIVAPVAVVVGFVGYHVEDFVTSDETRAQVGYLERVTLVLFGYYYAIMSAIYTYKCTATNLSRGVLLNPDNMQNNTPLESTTDLRVARELEVRREASSFVGRGLLAT